MKAIVFFAFLGAVLSVVRQRLRKAAFRRTSPAEAKRPSRDAET